MWEAFEHAGHARLDNLIAIVDVNRLGQRGPTMHEWDTSSLAARAAACGWDVQEIDGHDLEAIDAAYARALEADRPAVIFARTKKGSGVAAVEDQPNQHGKPLEDPEAAVEELGGERSLRVEVATPPEAPPYEIATRARSSGRATSSARRSRPAAPTATPSPGSARSTRGSSRSTARSATRPTPSASPPSTPTASSRCTSPSSRWSPPPSACRRAAGSPSPPRSAPSSAAPTTSSAWPRSPTPTSSSAARTSASRSARTAPRRWRSKTSPPSAPSSTASSSTRATPTRPSQLLDAMREHRGFSYMRTTREETPVLYEPGEAFEIGGSRTLRSGDDDAVTLIGAGITLHECLDRRRRAGRARGSRPGSSTSTRSSRSTPRPCSPRPTRPRRWSPSRTTGPEGGIGETVAGVLARAGSATPLVSLAVTERPGSGPPEAPARRRRDRRRAHRRRGRIGACGRVSRPLSASPSIR